MKLKSNFKTRILMPLSTTLLLASCGNPNQASKEKALEDIKSLNKEITAQSFRGPQERFYNEKTKDLEIKSDVFLKKFCSFISKTPDPKAFEGYMATPQASNYAYRFLTYLGQFVSTCNNYEVQYSAYPLQVVKFKTPEANILISLSFTENMKIKGLYALALREDVQASHEMVEMRDGKKLGTFIFRTTDNKPKGTIYIRTPYLHTNGENYMSFVQQFLPQGLNVVLQTNRGVHTSQGDFRWLHNQNTDDGEDSVKWIAKQSYSNQKVIAFGISYDGYNALATGVNSAYELKGVLACSAPTSASTDSLSANEVPESGLLRYIWQRESTKPIENFNLKLHYLQSTKTPIADYDNYLYGRDLADWNDFLKSHYQNERSYWETRTLVPMLRTIKRPTYHIAGTANDQDSRDTILAYNIIQKTSMYKEDHKLFIHNQGHGCGNFFQTQAGSSFLNLAKDDAAISEFKKMPKVIQVMSDGKFTGDSEYPVQLIEEKSLELKAPYQAPDVLAQIFAGTNLENFIGVLTDHNQTGPDASPKTIAYNIEVKEDMIINGTPELKIGLISTMPRTIISTNIFIIRPDGSRYGLYDQLHASTTRSAIVLKDEAGRQLQKNVIYYPVIKKLTKGATIQVVLHTQPNFIVPIFNESRDDILATQGMGIIGLTSSEENKSVLILPTEKKVEATQAQ